RPVEPARNDGPRTLRRYEGSAFIARNRRIRSGVGGWVEKIAAKEAPRNGFTMKRLDCAGEPTFIGCRTFAVSSFWRALARASGSPSVRAPTSSARNSRDREIES